MSDAHGRVWQPSCNLDPVVVNKPWRTWKHSLIGAFALLTCGAAPAAAHAAPGDRDDAATRDRDDGPQGDHFWHRPRLTAAVGMGAGQYWRGAAGDDWGAGPAWQARLGAQLHPIIGAELRYVGAEHSAGAGLDVDFAAYSLNVRVAIPLRVRPYLALGAGWYTLEVEEADGDALASPDPALQVPMGLGVEVPVIDRISLEAEVEHRFLASQGAQIEFDPGAMHLWSAGFGARAYF